MKKNSTVRQWTHANRVRRSVSGELGGREFEIVPLVAVDAALVDRKIDNWEELILVKPEQLGRWLNTDAVVYKEILDYEAYYAALISVWRVTARAEWFQPVMDTRSSPPKVTATRSICRPAIIRSILAPAPP